MKLLELPGGDFKVIIFKVIMCVYVWWWGGGNPKRGGAIFMGEVDSSRHHVKILIWQL